LEIPCPTAAIASDPPDKCSQTGNSFMDALALPAGLGIMDKNRFIDRFQIIHQNMMNNPVPKISGKNLPQFRFLGEKADRTARAVAMISQFPAKFKQFPFLIYLKPQGIHSIPFIFPAKKILPVNIFKGKIKRKHYPPRTAIPYPLLFLLLLFWLPLLKLKFHALFILFAYSVPDQYQSAISLSTFPLPQ
jgi:hypothetical protein